MNRAYEKIRDTIIPVLLDKGFTKLEEKHHPGDFGGCYMIFRDAKELIRLTWDGKEQWFVLESTPTTSVTVEAEWIDILLQFYNPGKDGSEVVDEIAEDLKIALLDYLADVSRGAESA